MNKMPKPVTEAQFFLHQCDYLASRRDVIINDIEYNPDDYIINEAAEAIDEIIVVCKEKVANGCDREELKKIIADNNNGNPDPRQIHTRTEGEKILKLIKEM